MAAGHSAGVERRRSQLEAAAHERAAAAARRRAASFGVAERTEPITADALRSLEPHGWTLLHDRRWPGTRRGNIDHLAVGPGGVFVIDTKAWSGTVSIVCGSLFQSDECRDDALDAVRDQALAVESVLAPLGLAPLEVVPVLCFGRRGDVNGRLGRVRLVSAAALQGLALSRGARLADEHVRRICEELDRCCPPHRSPTRVAPMVPRVVLPAPTADAEEQQLFTPEDLRRKAIEAARKEPIESWMAFLDPDQARYVRRSFTGPCRVRGAAGTGKTVVGLHRAAYLAATRPGRMLFTAYVRTLPHVLGRLYAQLAPDTVDRVEFVGLHQWAVNHLRQCGVSLRLDGRQAEQAFAHAFRRWDGRTSLVTASTPFSYWRDEVDAVIKGRALTTFDHYEQLQRVGRRTRLTSDERRVVWELYLDYDHELRARNAHDFNDVLEMALRSVEEDPPEPGYTAVIADEIQDLNLVGARLLFALGGDGPDGLTLIGDGQQAVYPGGYTLAEAGISVAGRAMVMRTNYRNTRSILDYATRLVARDDFDDLGAELERGQREIDVLRDGDPPVELRARDREAHDGELVAEIRRASLAGVRLADMAVLVPTNQLAYYYRGVLSRAGLSSMLLQEYDGTATAAVKIGTFQRAKGLEFARVFLPRVVLPGDASADLDPATRERLERERRTYFVAMTRARDLLWVGFCPPDGDGRPSRHGISGAV